MMPWRDQVRLAWRAARWLWWPPGWPLWSLLVIWTAWAAGTIGFIARGVWWPYECALGIAVLTGVAMGPERRRRAGGR